jgi:hypothetical protein
MRFDTPGGIGLVLLLGFSFNFPIEITLNAEVVVHITKEAPLAVGSHNTWAVDS